jgi:hypothetical protein
MDQKAISDLLYRIANDPDFRDRLVADPIAELGKHGIQVQPGDVPTGGITLPANEEIMRNLDVWSTHIWTIGGGTGDRMPRIWLGDLPV